MIIKIDVPSSIIPINSVILIFSLKIITEIKIEKINSICPTALTSAAVAKPNATNHPKVAPVPNNPAGKLGFQNLNTALSCSLLKTNIYSPTIIVWKIIAINEINNDLSKSGPSTDIIDILNVTTDAARSSPDNSPINVPKDVIDLNKILIVSKKFFAFFAYDNNKTEITPNNIPSIIGKEKITLRINVSKKAINITSVFEKAMPAAKLL